MTMTARETMEEKAARLAYLVDWVEDGLYFVPGDSGQVYEVRGGDCPCDSFRYRSDCSHSRAVALVEEEREAEADQARARMAQIEEEVSELREEREGLKRHLRELVTPPAELQREREREEARARREAARVAEEARRRASGEELEFQL